MSTEMFDQLLTPTEKAVLAELAEGKSNKEIAEELNISINTAKSHVSSILQKTGCKTRLELVVKYYKSADIVN